MEEKKFAGIVYGAMTKFYQNVLVHKFDELRTELRGEIADSRSELKAEISGVRTDLKGEIGDLRAELKEEVGELSISIGNIEKRVEIMTEMLVEVREDHGSRIERLERRVGMEKD